MQPSHNYPRMYFGIRMIISQDWAKALGENRQKKKILNFAEHEL